MSVEVTHETISTHEHEGVATLVVLTTVRWEDGRTGETIGIECNACSTIHSFGIVNAETREEIEEVAEAHVRSKHSRRRCQGCDDLVPTENLHSGVCHGCWDEMAELARDTAPDDEELNAMAARNVLAGLEEDGILRIITEEDEQEFAVPENDNPAPEDEEGEDEGFEFQEVGC